MSMSWMSEVVGKQKETQGEVKTRERNGPTRRDPGIKICNRFTITKSLNIEDKFSERT